jgi:hypothetical protein
MPIFCWFSTKDVFFINCYIWNIFVLQLLDKYNILFIIRIFLMAKGVAQVVEYLPSKCEALSSFPSNNNNKKC